MSRSFLVLESDVLVAQDIGETLLAANPGASVSHASTLEEALEFARALDRIDLAVLHLSNDKIRASGLGQALDETGTSLLVLGDEEPAGDAQDSRWQRIGLPFTSAMIVNALERMGLKS